MNVDKILALIGAGYTKAEIEAMEAPSPAPAPEPAPAPAPSPEPAPAPAPAPVDNMGAMADAVAQLTAAVRQMQIANIHNAGMPPTNTTPADYIASIINPVSKKEV